MNNNISFNGNFIKPAIIKKLNKDNKYIPHQASIIQIDTANKKDIFALKEAYRDWDTTPSTLSFSDIIYEDAKDIHNMGTDNGFHKFFVLSNQKKDFDNLNHDEILAMTEISSYPDSKKISIEALEVHPDHNYWSQNRNYKGIGRAFLDSIKQVFKDKEINVRSVPSALDFYRQNGFYPITRNSHDLQYLNTDI